MNTRQHQGRGCSWYRWQAAPEAHPPFPSTLNSLHVRFNLTLYLKNRAKWHLFIKMITRIRDSSLSHKTVRYSTRIVNTATDRQRPQRSTFFLLCPFDSESLRQCNNGLNWTSFSNFAPDPLRSWIKRFRVLYWLATSDIFIRHNRRVKRTSASLLAPDLVEYQFRGHSRRWPFFSSIFLRPLPDNNTCCDDRENHI